MQNHFMQQLNYTYLTRVQLNIISLFSTNSVFQIAMVKYDLNMPQYALNMIPKSYHYSLNLFSFFTFLKILIPLVVLSISYTFIKEYIIKLKMEEMALPRFNPNNLPLSFKKMRSSDNINLHTGTSTCPLKIYANNFNLQANDRNTTNVLRETTNAPFFKEKYQSHQNVYSIYDGNYNYTSVKNQFSSSHDSFKFKDFTRKLVVTPKFQSNSQCLTQSHHRKIPAALSQNTSQNLIPNVFKKGDSKNQSIYLNNGIKSDYLSGKQIQNCHKQNFNNSSCNTSRKQMQGNFQNFQKKRTSIQKTRQYEKRNNRAEQPKNEYRPKLYTNYSKENNGYDDYQYKEMGSRKDKAYSKLQDKYSGYPNRPPIYPQNQTINSKNLFNIVKFGTGDSGNYNKNANSVNLRETVGSCTYGSLGLSKVKDSLSNSKKSIKQKYQQANFADTAPSQFFKTEGNSTIRKNKGHGRWISNLETKSKNAQSFQQNNDGPLDSEDKFQDKFSNSSNNFQASKNFFSKNFVQTQSVNFSLKAPNNFEQKKQQIIIPNQQKKVQSKSCELSIQDFHLGKCKGQGRFGKVFPATHKASGFICAIKQVKKQSLKYITDQFIQEVKLQFHMNHSNLVKLYGIFSDKQHIYLLMEYMEGGSLYSLIKKEKKISEQESAMILYEVVNGLQYMHNQSIVHRDIKPQNIVITHGVCKICDFGWAAYCSGRRNTYCGTLDYVSPEVLSGEQYDSSVDIWCYGVLAYELMVGKAPFYNISRKQTMKKIQQCEMSFPEGMSHEAKNFIQNILQKNPVRRLNIGQIVSDKFFEKVRYF